MSVDYEKLSSIEAELDEVICWVRLMPRPLIKSGDISKKLSKELTEHLKSMGVKAKNGYTPGEYGGSGDGFWYNLTNLLKELKIIRAILLVGKAIRLGMERLVDIRYESTDINATINLAVATKVYAEEYPAEDMRLRLTTMFRMAHTEAKKLSAEYPLFNFSASIIMEFEANNFTASFHVKSLENQYEYRKLCNIANGVRLVNGVSFDFRKAKFRTFKHSVFRQTLIIDSKYSERDYRFVGNAKNYYTVISDKFFGEYGENKKRMNYLEFEKKMNN